MLVASLVALAFRGGDLSDLARTLSAWSHGPVVAFVQAERARPRMGGGGYIPPEWKPAKALPGFELGFQAVGDGKDFSRLLRVKTRVESSAREEGIALWDPAWEPSTTFIEGGGIPLPDGWKPAEAEKTMGLKAGKASFSLPTRQAVRASQVAKLAWSKPVKTHWLLGQMWVVPVGQGVGERATLSAVARAVSGTLAETKESYEIRFDPVAFRARAKAYVASRAPQEGSGPLKRAGYEVVVRTWDQIDDASINRLYSEPHMGFSLPVAPGTPLAGTLWNYYSVLKKLAENPPEGKKDEYLPYEGMLKRIDPKGEVRIVITQNMGAGGGWPRVGGGTILL